MKMHSKFFLPNQKELCVGNNLIVEVWVRGKSFLERSSVMISFIYGFRVLVKKMRWKVWILVLFSVRME